LTQGSEKLKTIVRRDVDVSYLLALPQGRKHADNWPVVLFLHGAGERGRDLELVKKHGPPRLVDQGREFPFILVSPQCPAEQWWRTETLHALLDEIIARHEVDENRIYVTGMSMGGFGTWSLAIETPERFAAVAPICGGGFPYLAFRMRKLPIWAFHGAGDEVVPLYESERMVKAVNEAGGQAQLTVYSDLGHDCWTQAYDNPALYDWMLSHRRA
jgi:predicted peptidase